MEIIETRNYTLPNVERGQEEAIIIEEGLTKIGYTVENHTFDKHIQIMAYRVIYM